MHFRPRALRTLRPNRPARRSRCEARASPSTVGLGTPKALGDRAFHLIVGFPMQLIPNDLRIGASGGKGLPRGVRTHCPFCNELVVFGLRGWSRSSQSNVTLNRSGCPHCQKSPTFLAVSSRPEKTGPKTPTDIFMYPGAAGIRSPWPQILGLEQVTDPLGRAYASAVRAYNTGDWNGCAVHCGRVLEGLAKDLVSPRRPMSLATMIRELPRHIDLDAPVVHLADSIREGRNIGAHFDQELETDQETAEKILELLEYLIDYLLVLPSRIEELRSALSRDGGLDAT